MARPRISRAVKREARRGELAASRERLEAAIENGARPKESDIRCLVWELRGLKRGIKNRLARPKRGLGTRAAANVVVALLFADDLDAAYTQFSAWRTVIWRSRAYDLTTEALDIHALILRARQAQAEHA